MSRHAWYRRCRRRRLLEHARAVRRVIRASRSLRRRHYDPLDFERDAELLNLHEAYRHVPRRFWPRLNVEWGRLHAQPAFRLYTG